MKKIFLLPLYMLTIISLAGCSSSPEVTLEQRNVTNLVDSTTIIRSLLCTNQLGQLLEEHDPAQLEILINNFSPSAMALESEVLNATTLVCVYFYIDEPAQQEFIKTIQELADAYKDKVKFVLVDAQKLFSIAQSCEVEQFPVIAWIKNRDLFEYTALPLTKEVIQEKITAFMQQ